FKALLTISIYSLNVMGSSFFSFFTKNKTIIKDIRQKAGMEKKGKYQINEAKKAPNIGLNTLPIVLEVSTMPKAALASSSRGNKSPIKGNTMGIAPAAPIP